VQYLAVRRRLFGFLPRNGERKDKKGADASQDEGGLNFVAERGVQAVENGLGECTRLLEEERYT